MNADSKGAHALRAEHMLQEANRQAVRYAIAAIDAANARLDQPWSDQALETEFRQKDNGGDSIANYRNGINCGCVHTTTQFVSDALELSVIDGDAFGLLQEAGGHRATLPMRRALARAKVGWPMTAKELEDEVDAFRLAKRELDKLAAREFGDAKAAKSRLVEALDKLAKISADRANHVTRRTARKLVSRRIAKLLQILDGLKVLIWETQHPRLQQLIEFEGWRCVEPEFNFEQRARALAADLMRKDARNQLGPGEFRLFGELVKSIAVRHLFELDGDLPNLDTNWDAFEILAMAKNDFQPADTLGTPPAPARRA